jgi:ubiquinone/menaquinone biosynthesis C-methylase UbiE
VGANEFERRRWNDEGWAALWPRRERLTDKVTEYLLAALALRAGERVLEVGSGGGKTALAAAEAVGGKGAVVGADLSAPLNRLAEQRVSEAGAGNVTCCLADVQTDTVEGGPCDAAMSQFGVMFFDEPVMAFRNIRAHLKPGGRIAFACWQAIEANPWFFASAVAEFAPPPPAPAPGKSPTGPFALADPDTATHILQSAGFADIRRTAHQIEVEVPEDSVVDEAQLRFVGIPEDKLAAAQAAVDAHMQQFKLESGLSRFPLAFQLFQAANG